jgi:hypothetical protein
MVYADQRNKEIQMIDHLTEKQIQELQNQKKLYG